MLKQRKKEQANQTSIGNPKRHKVLPQKDTLEQDKKQKAETSVEKA